MTMTMNRQQRRGANARKRKAFYSDWQEVPTGTVAEGRVHHVVYSHDDDCPCVNGLPKPLDFCMCKPDVATYLQPLPDGEAA